MAAQWLHMDLQLFQDENEAVNLHTVCMIVKFCFVFGFRQVTMTIQEVFCHDV